MNDKYNVYRGRYKEFIESKLKERPENKRFKYSECHHIIPRCLGGKWLDGYVYLSYSEHFTAHLILVQENPNIFSLAKALLRMTNDHRHCTPEEYEQYKISHLLLGKLVHTEEWKSDCSNWMTGRKQVLGRVWVHNSISSRMILPEEVEDYLNAGYSLGRGSVHNQSAKETISKISASRIWINNGSESTMISKDADIPEGYMRGRLLNRDIRGRIVKCD